MRSIRFVTSRINCGSVIKSIQPLLVFAAISLSACGVEKERAQCPPTISAEAAKTGPLSMTLSGIFVGMSSAEAQQTLECSNPVDRIVYTTAIIMLGELEMLEVPFKRTVSSDDGYVAFKTIGPADEFRVFGVEKQATWPDGEAPLVSSVVSELISKLGQPNIILSGLMGKEYFWYYDNNGAQLSFRALDEITDWDDYYSNNNANSDFRDFHRYHNTCARGIDDADIFSRTNYLANAEADLLAALGYCGVIVHAKIWPVSSNRELAKLYNVRIDDFNLALDVVDSFYERQQGLKVKRQQEEVDKATDFELN